MLLVLQSVSVLQKKIKGRGYIQSTVNSQKTLKQLFTVRAIPEKNTWGGKTAGDIFFYGWSVRTFFKLYGSLVFDKF